MEVICIQEDAYSDLPKKSYEYIKSLHNIKEEKWILPDKVMEMLGVKPQSFKSYAIVEKLQSHSHLEKSFSAISTASVSI